MIDLQTFAHSVILHGAGCSAADADAFCAPGINSLHQTTQTVFHVYPSGGAKGGEMDVADKNTADLGGMLFFDLRLLGNPVECAEQFIPGTTPPDPSATFDCENQETKGSFVRRKYIVPPFAGAKACSGSILVVHPTTPRRLIGLNYIHR